MSPSTRPPAGVPTSGGSGKYVAIAVLLLLGIGGVLIWRFVLSKPDPVAVIPTALPTSSSAPQNVDPRIEDIPPPPPVVDAGPDTGAPKPGPGQQVVVVQANGCGPTCTGVESPELVGALRQRAGAARGCYEAALRTDPHLSGRVSVNLRVGSNGSVCSSSLGQNDLGPGVGACIANVFRGVTYPAPKGGCKDVNIPLSFAPQQR